ncbi:MAG: hypothetical protein RBU30_16740, partial [Polyangia bacterium]|nr:hypothetical protein [Polyangia bacterium]
ACTSTCTLNTTGCSGRCGDGTFQAGYEQCEGGELGGVTCQTLGFYSGTPTCTPSCTISTTGCSGYCGDGTRNGEEQCEGTDLGGTTCQALGYYEGTPSCTSSCTVSPVGCTGNCGDGTFQPSFEQCEGSELGGKDCTNYGFYGGTLACNTSCQVNTAGCEGSCGDGSVQGAAGEDCDGSNLGMATCETLGYYRGTLSCSPYCRFVTTGCSGLCGDLIRDEGHEECDGNELGGLTCALLGYHEGTLGCLSNCTLNRGGCLGMCGDGVKNPPYEGCDGSDFGGLDCTDFTPPLPGVGYFYSGALACTDCAIDTSGCSQYCGDGMRNGTEQCDANDFGGANCQSYKFYSGNLSCNADCTAISIAACAEECGDGIRNGPEVCDGNDLGALTCQSFGYHGGELICDEGCGGVSTAACEGYCGDGILNGPEQCDGFASNPSYCRDYDPAYHAGHLVCNAYCQLEDEICMGWHRETLPIPSTWRIRDVWATARDDIWAVASDESSIYNILHFDGAHWAIADSGTGAYYSGIWASGPDNAFAVGTGGKIRRWNGTSWSNHTSGTVQNLLDVWGYGSTVFAVGNSGAALRYNGTSWSATTGIPAVYVRGVHGTSETNVFAATSGGAYQFNGTSWSSIGSPPASGNLSGVWATGGAAWFVGLNFGNVGYWSGTSWVDRSAPTSYELRGIWARSSSDLFVVGRYGVAFHWNGSGWKEETMLTPFDLHSIHAVPGGDFVAVGQNNTVRRLTGQSWVEHDTGSTGYVFLDVWGGRATNHILSLWQTWIVGTGGEIWRGGQNSWTQMTSGTTNELWGIWGVSAASFVLAVGQGGTILLYNGSSWGPMTSGTTAWLYDVHGSSTTHAFAVGTSGTIRRWNGSSWSGMTSGTTAMLNGVHVLSETEAYAVGGSGTGVVLRYNGTSWSQFATLPTYLSSVWASSSSDLWVAGEDQVYRYDGANWTSIPSPAWPGEYITSIKGRGPTDIYAVGGMNVIMHWNGFAWAPMTSGTQAYYEEPRALFINPNSYSTEVYAVGNQVTVQRLNWIPPTRWGGTCDPPLTLYCDETAHGTTAGGTNRITSYSGGTCVGTYSELGKEAYYRFDSPIMGWATARLTPTQNNLDLVVIGGVEDNGACDPASCVAGSNMTGLSPDEVTFPVKVGQTFYLVVDSPTDVPSGFSIEISCDKNP